MRKEGSWVTRERGLSEDSGIILYNLLINFCQKLSLHQLQDVQNK